MNNMAKQRRASRRRGCRRNRRLQNGGDGYAYTLGSHVAGAPIVNNYGQEITRFPSCEEATRPGYMLNAGPALHTGLPGFGSQRGGRYTFEPGPNGMMEPRYSGCGEGLAAVQNPYNQPSGFPGSVLTAPPPQVPIPSPMGMKGGRRNRRNRSRKQRGGVYGHEQQYAADAMVYEAPRSGYSHTPSNSSGGNAGTLADGKTPFLVNVPYSAQPAPSPACLKTGGGRKSRKNRKTRKSRKNRKTSRRVKRN